MPDQTVKVTFIVPDVFTFDPPTAIMTAAGKINRHRHPGNADWMFVSVNELPSPEYSSTITGNGSEVHINDAHTSNGPSHYTVTVQDTTGTHTSNAVPTNTQPPMIMNE